MQTGKMVKQAKRTVKAMKWTDWLTIGLTFALVPLLLGAISWMNRRPKRERVQSTIVPQR